MPIGFILQYRYPNADPLADYRVQDDGEGPYISYWNTEKLGAQPTNDQLRSWWLAAEKWGKKTEIKILADADYDSILAPEGNLTKLQRDEIIEKRAVAIAKGLDPTKIGNAQENTASQKVADLRTKRDATFQTVNQITQGATETIEQAVARVQAVSW